MVAYSMGREYITCIMQFQFDNNIMHFLEVILLFRASSLYKFSVLQHPVSKHTLCIINMHPIMAICTNGCTCTCSIYHYSSTCTFNLIMVRSFPGVLVPLTAFAPGCFDNNTAALFAIIIILWGIHLKAIILLLCST